MIELIQGDITAVPVEVIVNAANAGLRGGGGVDGAIHRAGGPAIMAACREIIRQRGRLETGDAVITTGGELSARFVIHTVGPIYDPSQHDRMADLLGRCYTSALKLADEHCAGSIAFPNISTGVYGYPKRAAAEVAIRAVNAFLTTPHSLQKICYVCFDRENFEIYSELLP